MYEPSGQPGLALVDEGEPAPVLRFSPPQPRHSSAGRYVIDRTLGEGGMGVVYQAVDVDRGERVALKTLTGRTPNSLWRFKREFRSLADVVHPNLVQLYELFSHEDELFLAMELVEGVEFDEYVWTQGRPDYDRLRDAMRQLVLGVAALHAAGKLHLDIKPSNVMVTSSGRVVLLDFGLIQEVPGELTYTPKKYAVSGTPWYMAPEQIEPKQPGEPADCYAIGVLLYEALTGVLPFDSSDLVELLRAKREAELVPPKRRASAVPPDLDELAVRLLDRDPSTRATLADILAVVDPRGRPMSPAQPPVVYGGELEGRSAQLRTLEAELERSRRRPVTVYVEGESGVGKTALVRAFWSRARQNSGAVVLEARCYQRDSLPLKTVDALVDSLTGYLQSISSEQVDSLLPQHTAALVRLFPVLDRVKAIAEFSHRSFEEMDGQTLRTRAFGALRELLTRLSHRRPLVLFIDDLQWGDVESGWVLEELLDGEDAPPLLFVSSFRTGETASSPLLRELLGRSDSSFGGRRTLRLSLGRLRHGDARAAARRLLAEQGLVDEDLADAIAHESQGSPLFIEELVRYRGQADPAARAATGGASLEQVVMSRIRHVDERAQRILEILAVAGRPIPIPLALRASGIPSNGEGLLRVLTQEKLARVIGMGDARQVECFHGRTRELILGELDASKTESLHAGLAAALDCSGARAERLTVHLLGAGRRREAGEMALLAAAEAENALAFERAAVLYSIAIRNMAMSEERRRDLQTRRATALAGAGKVSLAAGLYLRNSSRGASDLTPDTPRAQQRLVRKRLAAQKLLEAGHLEEGAAVLRSVMAAADLPLPDTQARARFRWWTHRMSLSWDLRWMPANRSAARPLDFHELLRCDACGTAATGLGTTDPLHGAELGARHLRLAIKTGDATRMVQAASFYAAKLAAWGKDALSQRWFDWADRVGVMLEDSTLDARLSMMRGLAFLEVGEWGASLNALSEAEGQIGRSHAEYSWDRVLLRASRLAALMERGELRRVADELPALIEAGTKRENHSGLLTAGPRCGHWVGLMKDDLAGARSFLDLVARQLPKGMVLEPHLWILAGRVEIAHYAGDFQAAERLLRRHWPAFRRSWAWRHPGMRNRLERLRGMASLGLASRDIDCAKNLRLARKAGRRLERSRRRVDRVHGQAILAQISALTGGSNAAVHLDRAAEAFIDAGMRLYAAAHHYLAGQVAGEGKEDGRRAKANAAAANEGILQPATFFCVYAPAISCEQ